jgi:hypothetical protein
MKPYNILYLIFIYNIRFIDSNIMGPKASTITDPNEAAVLENYHIIQEIPN